MAKVGFIYKITDNTNGNKYYGSTTQSVSQRMTGHRFNLKTYDSQRCSSFDILKNGDWRYDTVEKFMYDERFELRNREQHYIENNECVNKCRAYTTPEQATQRNSDYTKKYYREHLEHIKEYREDHKEESSQYKKEWYTKEKERILKSRKESYQDNKASLKRYHEKKAELNAKVTCECGAVVNKQNMLQHKKNKKHQSFIK
jgi:hypothetical protein